MFIQIASIYYFYADEKGNKDHMRWVVATYIQQDYLY